MPHYWRYSTNNSVKKKLLQWETTPNKNPFSGKRIKIGGPTFTELEIKFVKIFERKPNIVYDGNKIKFNQKQCLFWKYNIGIDPITKGKLDSNGNRYKAINFYVKNYLKKNPVTLITKEFFLDELKSECILYLPLNDILNFRRVCHDFNNLIVKSGFWRIMLRRDYKLVRSFKDGDKYFKLYKKRYIKEKYFKQLINENVLDRYGISFNFNYKIIQFFDMDMTNKDIFIISHFVWKNVRYLMRKVDITKNKNYKCFHSFIQKKTFPQIFKKYNDNVLDETVENVFNMLYSGNWCIYMSKIVINVLKEMSNSYINIQGKKNIQRFLKKYNKFKNFDRIITNMMNDYCTLKSSPHYQSKKKSKSDLKKYPLTEQECEKWIKKKTINPRTGKKIVTDGPTYKKIAKQAIQLYGLY